MKGKPKAGKRKLHEPIAELVRAKAMPKKERCNNWQGVGFSYKKLGTMHKYSADELKAFLASGHK